MENVGIFHSHFVYFTAIGNIMRPFGTFFPVLVCCTKKIWQPCPSIVDLAPLVSPVRLWLLLPELAPEGHRRARAFAGSFVEHLRKKVSGVNRGCQVVYCLTEIPNLGNFGGPWNGKCGHIL
jgi:hypothetical protein